MERIFVTNPGMKLAAPAELGIAATTLCGIQLSARSNSVEDLQPVVEALAQVIKITRNLEMPVKDADGKLVYPATCEVKLANLEALDFHPDMMLAKDGLLGTVALSLMKDGKIGSSIMDHQNTVDELTEELKELKADLEGSDSNLRLMESNLQKLEKSHDDDKNHLIQLNLALEARMQAMEEEKASIALLHSQRLAVQMDKNLELMTRIQTMESFGDASQASMSQILHEFEEKAVAEKVAAEKAAAEQKAAEQKAAEKAAAEQKAAYDKGLQAAKQIIKPAAVAVITPNWADSLFHEVHLNSLVLQKAKKDTEAAGEGQHVASQLFVGEDSKIYTDVEAGTVSTVTDYTAGSLSGPNAGNVQRRQVVTVIGNGNAPAFNHGNSAAVRARTILGNDNIARVLNQSSGNQTTGQSIFIGFDGDY